MLQLVSHERLFVRFPSPSNYTVRTFYLCYSRVRPHPADFGSRISGLTLIYNKKLLDGSPPTQLSDLVSRIFILLFFQMDLLSCVSNFQEKLKMFFRVMRDIIFRSIRPMRRHRDPYPNAE